MATWKSGLGNFSGTKWAREVSGANLLHPDTFSDFPEPHPAVPCSRKFSQISGSNSQRLGIKKGGTCRAIETIGSPRAPSPFKSVRSIQIGPFWYKKELSGKSYLLNSHVTLLALLEGVCSKIDIRERISGRPLQPESERT